MKTTKKVAVFFSMILIFTLAFGTLAHAANNPTLDTPEDKPIQDRYAILDGITYGLSFSSDNKAYCYANGTAGAATKFVVRGTLHKKDRNNYYQKMCSWPAETTYNTGFIFDHYALEATPGDYLFTLYVDVYKGDQCESLVFTKYKTKQQRYTRLK